MIEKDAGTKFWRVVKQFFREFWFALVVAVIWTIFCVWRSQPDIASLIANFSGSFFLASWAAGQYYRIIYRHDVEDWFSNVGQKFGALIEMLEPVVRFAKMQLEKPGIEPEVRDAANAVLATAAQLTAANAAFLQARNQVQSVSWYLDQSSSPTPLFTRTDPRIYNQPSAGPNWPPPNDDKPTKATSGS